MNIVGRYPEYGEKDYMPVFINPRAFPLSIVTILFVYLPVLLPSQLSGTINASSWNILSVVFCFIVIIGVYVAFYMFLRSIVNNEFQYSALGTLYGILDSILSLFHALGCIAYVIMLFRGSTTGDFLGPPGGGLVTAVGYDLFWTYCLANSVGFFLSAGTANIVPTTGWGTLWSMSCSITGMFALGVILATATSRLRRTKKISPPAAVRTYYRQQNRLK